MQRNSVEEFMSEFKKEINKKTPDVWADIEKKVLCKELASKLLQQLEGVPSLRGRLCWEKYLKMTDSIKKIERGA